MPPLTNHMHEELASLTPILLVLLKSIIILQMYNMTFTKKSKILLHIRYLVFKQSFACYKMD